MTRWFTSFCLTLGFLSLLVPTPGLAKLHKGECLSPEVSSTDDSESMLERGLALLREGDQLADEGNTTEAVVAYKRAFEEILPGMRGIPFVRKVNRDVTKRGELGEFLRQEFEREYPDEEIAADTFGFQALGLFPRQFDLKSTMIQMLTEEIAAFYDPATGTMHLIEEPAPEEEPGFFERLFGNDGRFDKAENKMVIAHEMTHALADQNYDLDAMQKAASDNTDKSLALTSLIEGEAMLTMLAASSEDWKGQSTVEIPSQSYDRLFALMGPAMMLGSGETLREAPAILSKTLVAPYLKGLVFNSYLANRGAWAAIDDAYRNPPLSTEQILHPEKYADEIDLPTQIALDSLEPGQDWTEVDRDVLGELQMQVLLAKHGGESAAAGWDGDNYVAFRSSDPSQIGLVWASTWDDPEEAREFAEAYLAYQTTKFPDLLDNPAIVSADHRRFSDGRVYAVIRRGVDVSVVEGFDPETTDRLIKSAFSSPRQEVSRDDSAPLQTEE